MSNKKIDTVLNAVIDELYIQRFILAPDINHAKNRVIKDKLYPREFTDFNSGKGKFVSWLNVVINEDLMATGFVDNSKFFGSDIYLTLTPSGLKMISEYDSYTRYINHTRRKITYDIRKIKYWFIWWVLGVLLASVIASQAPNIVYNIKSVIPSIGKSK